jgi:medium-chain acyl-[acyl-carrier-protein] hydrolase
MKTAPDESTASWISPKCRHTNSRLRLFCLPHAGSGGAAYNTWRSFLPSWVDLCPIQLPGRETRLAEPLCSNADTLVEAMAEAVSSWTDKPYVLFGHSMGALLAFELAQRLRARSERLPMLLVLSARTAAHFEPPSPPLHQLPPKEFLAQLEARYEGLPLDVLLDADMLDLFLPILRADITLIETYQFRPRPPLKVPILALAGSDDKTVTGPSMAAWQRHTAYQMQFNQLPGGHFYLWGESQAAFRDMLCQRLLMLEPEIGY